MIKYLFYLHYKHGLSNLKFILFKASCPSKAYSVLFLYCFINVCKAKMLKNSSSTINIFAQQELFWYL